MRYVMSIVQLAHLIKFKIVSRCRLPIRDNVGAENKLSRLVTRITYVTHVYLLLCVLKTIEIHNSYETHVILTHCRRSIAKTNATHCDSSVAQYFYYDTLYKLCQENSFAIFINYIHSHAIYFYNYMFDNACIYYKPVSANGIHACNCWYHLLSHAELKYLLILSLKG